ncbi:MAG TPA: hypothetical protein PK264_18370 [Hyphomicrobiaceae bacterium]|nr:hypothetical protein [Hyphomicrobiaceae bacterium]
MSAASRTLLLAMLLALAGCFDGRTTIDFSVPGKTITEVELNPAPDLDPIIELSASMAALKGDERQPSGGALCAQFFGNWRGRAASREIVTVSAATIGGRLACTIRSEGESWGSETSFADVASQFSERREKLLREFADGPLAKAKGLVEALNAIDLRREGPRRARFEIDLGRFIGEDRAVIPRLMMELMFGRMGHKTSQIPDAVLAKSFNRALVASLRMLVRGHETRRLVYEVRLARIVETNMPRRGDTVVIGGTYAEWHAAFEAPDGPARAKYYLVFEF